ncbi:MAG TPA: carboxypeptidase regulatory-like domain-containing protein [Acidobacteriaceae bacterium]
MRRLLQISLSLALVLPAFAVPSALAAAITGTVTNGTNNKPSPGDDVILISLQQRMQETARTKTDARGHYSIELPDQGMHLIRVDHQKASYFQPAPPNTNTVDVQVFDVAAAVPGITTEANVLRIETDPQGLHVTQSYFVKNDSTPPRTQFSSHSYEIYLPPDAKIEGAAAMGPGGMPVASSPAPMGEKGHYAYLFPLRPGETQFQVTYSLPYSGSAAFAPKLAGTADNVVIMVPKSMTFTPDPSAHYQPINDDINAQTFVAKNVSPTQALGFSVSGSGALPRDVQTAQAAAGNGQAGAAAAADNRPGGGLGNPIDTPDPLSKYKWWILSGVGLILAIAAAFFLRRPAQQENVAMAEVSAAPAPEQYAAPLTWTQGSPPPATVAPIPTPPVSQPLPPAPDPEDHTRSLLNSLKEELFALEADRARGNVGEVEYAAHKQALEAIIRRALNR